MDESGNADKRVLDENLEPTLATGDSRSLSPPEKRLFGMEEGMIHPRTINGASERASAMKKALMVMIALGCFCFRS